MQVVVQRQGMAHDYLPLAGTVDARGPTCTSTVSLRENGAVVTWLHSCAIEAIEVLEPMRLA